jgi:hypothetical protein
MRPRREAPPLQEDQAAAAATLEARVAELERTVAALARHSTRSGGTDDLYYSGPNMVVDNRADAAVIRNAGWPEG